jgi:hypothetical protein
LKIIPALFCLWTWCPRRYFFAPFFASVSFYHMCVFSLFFLYGITDQYDRRPTVFRVLQSYCRYTYMVGLLGRGSTRSKASRRTQDKANINKVEIIHYLTGHGLDDGGVGVWVPVGTKILSSPRRPDLIWGVPNLLSNG